MIWQRELERARCFRHVKGPMRRFERRLKSEWDRASDRSPPMNEEAANAGRVAPRRAGSRERRASQASLPLSKLRYQIARIKLSYRLNTHWKVRRCIRRYAGDGRQPPLFPWPASSCSVRAVDPRWRYPPGIHGNHREPGLTRITPPWRHSGAFHPGLLVPHLRVSLRLSILDTYTLILPFRLSFSSCFIVLQLDW